MPLSEAPSYLKMSGHCKRQGCAFPSYPLKAISNNLGMFDDIGKLSARDSLCIAETGLFAMRMRLQTSLVACAEGSLNAPQARHLNFRSTKLPQQPLRRESDRAGAALTFLHGAHHNGRTENHG